jgi:hypothetical protein
MTTKQQAVIDREELRIALAAVFMHAEISGTTTPIIADNEELAARGLRRADMLLKLHEQSNKGASDG